MKHDHPIKYPFYKYDNEKYSDFMISIMNSLESRFFVPNQNIVHEMDECLEIQFILQGQYKVGYEVNKKTFFKKKFGKSTVIGGFEILYEKKYIFNYEASTYMKC